MIISKTPNLVLDSNIEQFISRYFPENMKKARGVHLISQRIHKKETEILPPAQSKELRQSKTYKMHSNFNLEV